MANIAPSTQSNQTLKALLVLLNVYYRVGYTNFEENIIQAEHLEYRE